MSRAWAPIAGLIVIAVLQNIDIIAAKHRFAGQGAAELLRRDRRRREGADLGRDRGRLLPRARGLAPARRGRGHPSGAVQSLGIIARLRDPGAADLRRRGDPAAPGRVRDEPAAAVGLAARRSASRSRCSPPRISRSSTCSRSSGPGSWSRSASVAVAEPILLLQRLAQAGRLRRRRARGPGWPLRWSRSRLRCGPNDRRRIAARPGRRQRRLACEPRGTRRPARQPPAAGGSTRRG